MVTRKGVRRFFSYLFFGVIMVIAIAVLGEWFIEVARDKGWYERAGQRWDAIVGAVTAFVTSGTVLYPLTLLGGLVAGLWVDTWLSKRERPMEPYGDRITDPRRKQEVIGQRIGDCLKILGQAMGSDVPIAYTLALSDCESFIIDLGRRNNFAIPELRKNGEEAGCLRAAKYLADMLPLLMLDDDHAARQRADELVRKLNRMPVPKLREMIRPQ